MQKVRTWPVVVKNSGKSCLRWCILWPCPCLIHGPSVLKVGLTLVQKVRTHCCKKTQAKATLFVAFSGLVLASSMPCLCKRSGLRHCKRLGPIVVRKPGQKLSALVHCLALSMPYPCHVYVKGRAYIGAKGWDPLL